MLAAIVIGPRLEAFAAVEAATAIGTFLHGYLAPVAHEATTAFALALLLRWSCAIVVVDLVVVGGGIFRKRFALLSAAALGTLALPVLTAIVIGPRLEAGTAVVAFVVAASGSSSFLLLRNFARASVCAVGVRETGRCRGEIVNEHGQQKKDEDEGGRLHGIVFLVLSVRGMGACWVLSRLT